MNNSFEERRKHLRIPMVSVIGVSINGSEPEPSMMVDMSAGGVRILSQKPLGVGDTVQINIPLLEDQFINVQGDVVWTREMDLMKEYKFGVEYMAGVQFREPNKQIAKYIRRYV